MSIFRRRLMMQNREFIPPYDAKIEYLGSDSNAYINTGINGNNYYLRFTGHFMYTTHVGYGAIYGNYVSDKHNGTRLILPSFADSINSNLNTICTNAGNTIVNCVRNQKHYFSSDYNQVVIDSVTTTVSNKGNGTANNGIVCLFNRSLTNSTIRDIGLKIYDFQIHDNGILVRDFVPVRKDGVGYMYDEVSGELFGNAGTGSFILGPDI